MSVPRKKRFPVPDRFLLCLFKRPLLRAFVFSVHYYCLVVRLPFDTATDKKRDILSRFLSDGKGAVFSETILTVSQSNGWIERFQRQQCSSLIGFRMFFEQSIE